MSDLRVLEEAQKPSSVVSKPSTSAPVDRYPYGWRDVRVTLPTGEQRWQRIPLTLRDVLHPKEEDILLPGDEHERIRNYLYNVMNLRIDGDAHAVLLSDTNVDWDVPEIEPHRPDIAVIFNVRERRHWSTFRVAEEGTRPALIIEITSPATRHLDLEDKYEEYEQVSAPFYVIIDVIKRKRGITRELKGYRLTPEGYVPLLPNERGWLWLEPVSCWLAIVGEAIVCYDQQGNRIEDYTALATAKKVATERAAKAERARAAAEARTAAEVQARAAAEAQARVAAEAQAAAEARAAELEERLRRLEQMPRRSNDPDQR